MEGEAEPKREEGEAKDVTRVFASKKIFTVVIYITHR